MANDNETTTTDLSTLPNGASAIEQTVPRMTIVPRVILPDLPAAIDVQRIKDHFKRIEQLKQELLTPDDWAVWDDGRGNKRAHLKKEACERLALAFSLTEGQLDPSERWEWDEIPVEDRPNWPAGWTREPTVTAWCVLATHFGRTAIAGGKFSASEYRHEGNGKILRKDLDGYKHDMAAKAYARAYKAAVRRLLGGVKWIDSDRGEEEGAEGRGEKRGEELVPADKKKAAAPAAPSKAKQSTVVVEPNAPAKVRAQIKELVEVAGDERTHAARWNAMQEVLHAQANGKVLGDVQDVRILEAVLKAVESIA